jgi:glyoxylase-like metal-dependent hydrolase (beta-lactamase superfamily II)/rhodanese-related sulfurtransferase
MLFRQLFDQDSSTYTYLLADEASRAAVLIDPVIEQFARDRTLVEELQLTLRYVLDTHVHADHVTSSGLLRDHFGAKTVMSERAGVVCCDVQVKHGDRVRFGQHELEVRETPGHTSGCLSYVCHDARLIFTGDALLIRGCGRTDFQEGDAATLYRSVHEQILSLPVSFTVYPAHDYKGRTASSVEEELRLNPRLGQNKSEAEFVKLMSELKLPYPRKLDTALPANSRCGVLSPQTSAAANLDLEWAPIELSSVGVPEVTTDYLKAPPSELRVVDVREQDEYRGELGHIPGSMLVPLSTVGVAAREWSRERPVVLICRSGGRSGKAALQLAEAGFSRVASLRGGMTSWNAQGLPVQRGYIENRQG